MASVYKLVFLVLQAQCLDCFERFKRQSVDEYNLNKPDNSEYDYELPHLWEGEPASGRMRGAAADPRRKANAVSNPTAKKITHNLNNTFFQSLESYEVKAVPISEEKYRWIAKVVHSKHEDYPYVCTAVCIEQRIFITAGRCIATLKVFYTTVIYDKGRFPAKVFVLPDRSTKQMFDDVGFIVVYPTSYSGNWPTVQLFTGKRRGMNFEWFADLNYTHIKIEHKAIGYTAQKYVHKLKYANMKFRLTELEVVVDIYTCHDILSHHGTSFFVPCYHTCSSKEFFQKAEKCRKYLGTEGAAVFNFKTNKLLGLATWGISSMAYELPVGFTVPNSANYYRDLACARKIRANSENQPGKGHFQSLCKA